ncbi:MAG: hypothetical protein IKG14_00185 [Clostridia bacterium]|nr:hypothetical protein [Clostridia bacterium]
MYDNIDSAIDSDDINEILSGMSKDQFTDDENFGAESKVVFSTETYNFLKGLISQSKQTNMEAGAFLLGKKQGESEQIWIDDYSSQFAPDEGNYGFGSALDSQVQIPEIMRKIKDNNYNCLIHFHVHYKVGEHYDGFANQDRKLYSWLARDPDYQFFNKEELQDIFNKSLTDDECLTILRTPEKYDQLKKSIPSHRKVFIFGMLATPDRPDEGKESSNYQLSLLFCEPYLEGEQLRTKFYRIPYLYYLNDNNDICLIGSFVRRNPPILTNNSVVNNEDVYVQAIGADPNSGEPIKDIIVGKYKDGQFLFNDKKVTEDISTIVVGESQNQSGELYTGIEQKGNSDFKNRDDEEER